MLSSSIVNRVVLLAVISTATKSSFCHADSASACSRISGPSGINRCVLLNTGYPYYNDYQWATCLTNAYIQQITGGQDQCVDQTATYCWFQCMLETYNSSGPGVGGVCLCSSTGSTTTLSPGGSTLPPRCYSPDGTDCNWYADCLEAKYRCSGSSSGYAIEYATVFCQLFQQNLAQFSYTGQQWVNAVRKCLQVKLAPLLRQYTSPSCSDIRQTAFDSHTPCYLNPYQGAPSICDLPVLDVVPLLFTLQSAFTDITTADESICGALDVARGCNNQWRTSRPCLRAFSVDIKLLYGAVLPGSADLAITAAKYIKQIGQFLKWDSKGLRYFGCIVDWLDSGDSGILSILLAVPDNYNCLRSLLSGRKKRSTFDLDAVAADFENAVRNGSLLLQQDGVTLYVSGMAQCDPPACANGTAMSVTAPTPPTTTPKSSASQQSKMSALLMASVVITVWLAGLMQDVYRF